MSQATEHRATPRRAPVSFGKGRYRRVPRPDVPTYATNSDLLDRYTRLVQVKARAYAHLRASLKTEWRTAWEFLSRSDVRFRRHAALVEAAHHARLAVERVMGGNLR